MERSIAEKNSRLTWDSNPVCLEISKMGIGEMGSSLCGTDVVMKVHKKE